LGWSRKLTHWLFGSIAIYGIATIVLGFCFVLTALIGSVQKGDIDAFYSVYPASNTDEGLSMVVHVTETGGIAPIPACRRPLPEFKTKVLKDIHLTNWFGEKMHVILKITEWIIGLVYEVHLPPTVRLFAEQVRDPGFGSRPVDMTIAQGSGPQVFEEVDKTLSERQCDEAVAVLINANQCVGELNAIFWTNGSPRKIYGGHTYDNCITFAGATQTAVAPATQRPFLTRVKLALRLLRPQVVTLSP
jgi:hypothetical protein